MKTKLFIILAAVIAVLALNSCSNIEPAVDGYILQQKQTPAENKVFTADELFPEGNVEAMVIYPQTGWTAGPGEIIIFKALLLDESTGIYRDITNDPNTKWTYSWNGGSKTFNGNDPGLINGQEVVFRATYNKTNAAESVGHFIIINVNN